MSHIQLKLPDGSMRDVAMDSSIAQFAHQISPSLAKSAIAAILDGQAVDLSTPLIAEHHEKTIEILTEKNTEHPIVLEIIRHSTAHLLAHAVKELFPDAQVTIGPVVDNGFYYDFSYKRPFTPEDLTSIEQKMVEIQKRSLPVKRLTMSRTEAIDFFKNLGEYYKAELIESIPQGEILSLYQQDNFTDLCRGPHVPNTNKLKVFKLMKLAGAYWRGNHENEMLQRVYGTAWVKEEDQKQYLHQLEEAERRDHRRLGKELDLFHMQDEAVGMVFWHPKGWTLWQQIEQYMRKIYQDHGYMEVKAPQIIDKTLWEKSGHWENFHENMFITKSEDKEYAVKPMNCPGHVQLYNHGLHSYRDLPLRYGEFGSCHRNESSGSLHGIMRVRGFTQDDGHIFCTPEQIQGEVSRFTEILIQVYKSFGFDNIIYRLSTRPEKRVGSDETWDLAEKSLSEALDKQGVSWELLPGEGAFYGPKIEFSLKDSIGRVWQVGTIQVDFSMPQRLGAKYMDENNTYQTPVMLHRAILGSLERFIGILIENYAGNFPAWLAPVQVCILNIGPSQEVYAQEIANLFKKQGIRYHLDVRNEKINYKIRQHTLQKVPYIIVLGDKEKESRTVAVRARGNQDLGAMSIDNFIEKIQLEIENKGN